MIKIKYKLPGLDFQTLSNYGLGLQLTIPLLLTHPIRAGGLF